jgi:FkbM family methyltransferase
LRIDRTAGDNQLVGQAVIHKIKGMLIRLGPQHSAVRTVLWTVASWKGWKLAFLDDGIHAVRGDREMILATQDYVDVPSVLDYGELYFDTMEPDRRGGRDLWDYSKPAWHRYRISGLDFYMPAFPEEDLFDAYTHWYKPASGEIVWDVGAHVGFTTYALSKLVGPAGRVYAWEPDRSSYSCLLRNIERHQLGNVTTVPKALGGKTGLVHFEMDGTTTSGIRDYLEYPDAGRNIQTAEALSLEDACTQFGVPNYIKMDIEGGEIAVIESSLQFLRAHPIQWAIDTHHRVRNCYTYPAIENLFASIDYNVHSSAEYGNFWCTWASPFQGGPAEAVF